MKTMRTLAGSLALAFCLGGCISIGGNKNEPPASIYTLHAPHAGKPAAAKSAATQMVIVVPKPELPTGLASERIALNFEQGRRLDYYADAKWSGRLDDLLQDFIIQTARYDMPGTVVGTPDLAGSAKYRLIVTVTDFQAVYADTPDRPPRLDVGMAMTLIAVQGSAAKTNFTVKKSEMASANTITAVTQGLETLLKLAMADATQKITPHLKTP